MNPQWIIGPAVGTVIGYITNEIAIRMLFRPYKAIHIRGKRLPFTPGLIPKERHRLAAAISDLVSRQLLNQEILTESLLSQEMRAKIDRSLDEALIRLSAEERSPRLLLTQQGQEQALEEQITKISQSLAQFGCQKLLESGFSKATAEAVILDLRQRLLASPISPLRLFWDERLTQTLTEKLSTVLEEMVENQGPALLQGMLVNAAGDILDKPLGQHYPTLEPHLPALREKLHAHYETLVQQQLARLLATVDIGRIVEDRVNALDVAELEYLILGLMRKELRAVVMLGGILGGIMGLVNAVLAVWF